MRTDWRRAWAVLLFLLGLSITVLLGVLNGNEKQPSRSTSALLVVIGAGLQGWSAATFNKIGKADPSLAKASVRRLYGMVVRVSEARRRVERLYETGTPSEARRAMGGLSSDLSHLEEGLVEQIEDWREFHATAVRELEKGRKP